MNKGYIVTRIKFTHPLTQNDDDNAAALVARIKFIYPLVTQSDDVFTFDNAAALVEGLSIVNPEEFVIIKMKDGIPKRVKLTSNDRIEMYNQLINT